MPDVPPPEDLPSPKDMIGQLIDALPESMRSYWSRERPIDMRVVDVSRYLTREKKTPLQHIWIRANGRLPDDPACTSACWPMHPTSRCSTRR